MTLRQKLFVGGLLLLSSAALAQSNVKAPPVVDLPRGEITLIPSPDLNWRLVFECPHDCTHRILSVEDAHTHARKLVRNFDRSLSISWSPDSRWFFVNDELANKQTLSYLYDPVTLKATELSTFLEAGDRAAAQYLRAGHSYLEARRWIDAHDMLVTLEGRTDELPLVGFALAYRISVDGTVHKISEHVYKIKR
jgi:hypothetical protein